ncbi:anti-sigma factor [Pseudomonas sp. UBA6562]|uniref:anti-sigma factor n=1 Tax=Pseudomonas sp. UBA6562 TaxID=1947332 RepID=UPI0025D9BF43|nr:anti-sigma factor [Pseudomonas sp. UBA6562]
MNRETDSERPDDLDQLAGEYVLGTLPGAQRAVVASRLDHDQPLREAVEAWQTRLQALDALAPPVTPRAAVWERIARSVDGFAPPAQTPRWWQRLVLWQGLAGAGAFTSALLAVMLWFSSPAPTTYVVVLAAPSDRAAGWVVQASNTRALQLIPLETVQVPAGKVLQFWTKVDRWKAPVSLGLVQPGERAQVPVERLPPLEADQLFELTLEQAGGSPTGRPTGPIQFIGRAVKVI